MTRSQEEKHMRLFFILMRICRHVLEIHTRKVRTLSVLIVIDLGRDHISWDT